MSNPKNVLGGELKPCSFDPLTGFFRDGCCNTGPMDHGTHTVCVTVTSDFLQYSFSRGNDLITPRPEFNFPGLKPGDKWCLCASRWEEARQMDVAPPVHLDSTHSKTLALVELSHLKAHAVPEAAS
ncbi:MAG: DUF2237 domain-containing protein [Pseudomonadota bacterium]